MGVYRHINTVQEMRMNHASPVHVRAKRLVLPTEYNDIARSNALTSSWKNKKGRKQWGK